MVCRGLLEEVGEGSLGVAAEESTGPRQSKGKTLRASERGESH